MSIRRFKIISFLTFLLPFLTLNTCLFFYKFSSDFKLYPSIKWDNYNLKTEKLTNPTSKVSFSDCPKFFINKSLYKFKNKDKEVDPRIKFNIHFYLVEIQKPELEYVYFKLENKENYWCVKNSKKINYFIKKFPIIENLLIQSYLKNKEGFSIVKFPYLRGEISISRAARIFFNSNFIFKPLLILTSILIILYWYYNYKFLTNFKKSKNILIPKKFFIYGFLSSIFLLSHALGIDINDNNNKIIENLRRLILILFIIFEVLAQFSFTFYLNKNSSILKDRINLNILILKKIFVYFVLFLTICIFIVMGFFDYEKNFINIVEWNFFTLLLFYYLITFFLWKNSISNNPSTT